MFENIPKQEMNQQQRVVKDYMEMNTNRTDGPSVKTSSARISDKTSDGR
jgi:hypothetical protein